MKIDEVLRWLSDRFSEKGVVATVHGNSAREDGDWLYLPVHVEMTDAFDKATLLQEIENQWEENPLDRHRYLLLIPSAR